jgi:hypothetical protein
MPPQRRTGALDATLGGFSDAVAPGFSDALMGAPVSGDHQQQPAPGLPMMGGPQRRMAPQAQGPQGPMPGAPPAPGQSPQSPQAGMFNLPHGVSVNESMPGYGQESMMPEPMGGAMPPPIGDQGMDDDPAEMMKKLLGMYAQG